MSPTARGRARNLDLSPMRGLRASHEDFRHRIDVMQHINWDLLPADQGAHENRSRKREYSPAWKAHAGDFVWCPP